MTFSGGFEMEHWCEIGETSLLKEIRSPNEQIPTESKMNQFAEPVQGFQ